MADRVIHYTTEQVFETDLLYINRNMMSAVAKLTEAILGTSTLLNNLSCTPIAPASLNVQLGHGEIYQLENLDNTAYGVLPADVDHPLMKQGILWDAITLSCPAPGTAGFSINYLLQITYQDEDTDEALRPFYNSANPQQPIFNAVYQYRKGLCIATVKPGASAITGTQVTPSPDSGFVGAYVITVDYGQTEILAEDITRYPNAPFIDDKLQAKITYAQADARYELKGSSSNPTGTVLLYAGDIVPSGYLLCDGTAVSRTTYSSLFAIMGTTWGAGDGTTTFNLPDLRGRTPIGAGSGANLTNRILAQWGGEENHTLSEGEMPYHNHPAIGQSSAATGGYVVVAVSGYDGSFNTGGKGNGSIIGNSAYKGSNQPHNNMQPFSVVNYIIKT